jgi:hypothetical protein
MERGLNKNAMKAAVPDRWASWRQDGLTELLASKFQKLAPTDFNFCLKIHFVEKGATECAVLTPKKKSIR